jgi:membrane associated rhomboid family serine protease
MLSIGTTIPAASHHQAMDWSLVLVSQGIESIIDHDTAGGTWRVIVPDHDWPRAVEAIRQYHDENSGQTWRRDLPWTGLIFDWRCVPWLLVPVFLYILESAGSLALRSVGMMNGLAVKSGEWWRLLTAVTLHADLAHLAANLATGFLLLGLAMGAFGPGLGLTASLAAGVLGNLAGLAVYPDTYRGLGASGMIMGCLGVLSAQSVALLRHGLSHRQLAARGMMAGCLLLVLLGFSPEKDTDIVAHVAGFLAGGVLGVAAGFLHPRWRHHVWVGRLGQLFCAVVLCLAWWLALRFGRAI